MNASITISQFEETDPETDVTNKGLIAVDDRGEVVVAVIS